MLKTCYAKIVHLDPFYIKNLFKPTVLKHFLILRNSVKHRIHKFKRTSSKKIEIKKSKQKQKVSHFYFSFCKKEK